MPACFRLSTVIKKKVVPNADNAPYVVDELTLPKPNPWHCRTRFGGIDFFADPNKAAVCTWDGDVWIIDDITTNEISWRRICTGLFQPLGLKIINEEIHVTCRDQIARLVDRNNDQEIDFVEAFNSDHQVTTHWHEFTSGLAVDQKGYIKAINPAQSYLRHWEIIRTAKYGMRTTPHEKIEILVNAYHLVADKKAVFIESEMVPAWISELQLELVKGDGRHHRIKLHNTAYQLRPPYVLEK